MKIRKKEGGGREKGQRKGRRKGRLTVAGFGAVAQCCDWELLRVLTISWRSLAYATFLKLDPRSVLSRPGLVSPILELSVRVFNNTLMRKASFIFNY